ncbi:anion exchange protein 2-like isoform X2 [Dysidea avara]|uniref:anion exchange protein 2-like isoform X2 n=1 Tax=Dysidea avara TaxID=196820 RepID=UPI003333DC09
MAFNDSLYDDSIDYLYERTSPQGSVDNPPHEVFVELEELRVGTNEGDLEWEETARWILYEEDVVKETGKWGSPHVAALEYRHVLMVKQLLQQGSCILDLVEEGYDSVVKAIVTRLVEDNHIDENTSALVGQILHGRHKHQHTVTFWDDVKGNFKSDHHHHESKQPVETEIEMKPIASENQSIGPSLKKYTLSFPSASEPALAVQKLIKLPDKSASFGSNSSTNPFQEKRIFQPSKREMGKLLAKAEAIAVLVGATDFLSKPVVAFVRLAHSQELENMMEVPLPVKFIFIMLGPQNCDYHEVGRAVATLMNNKAFNEGAYKAKGTHDLIECLEKFLSESILLPPGDWDQELMKPVIEAAMSARRKSMVSRRNTVRKSKEERFHETDPSLIRNSIPFIGIYNNFKVLKQRYKSDWVDWLTKDGIKQCLLSIIFGFMICIAPAIAFGGLMEEITGNIIGTRETLLAHGFCGILYSLFSVQPIVILALTGPVLVFEEVVFETSEYIGIEYISWRTCIGLWVMVILILLAATEATCLVTTFTRFSEEVFTAVVAIFFIAEAIYYLVQLYKRNPLRLSYSNENDTSSMSYLSIENTTLGEFRLDRHHTGDFYVYGAPNTALFSTVLCLGSFAIAYSVKQINQSTYFSRQVRNVVSDFGMSIAIILMVGLSVLLKDKVLVETLKISNNGYDPTIPSARGWVINPLGVHSTLSGWAVIGAILPGVLASVLIFVEGQLTLLAVAKPENQLRKGSGYHYDLLLMGFMVGFCSLLGFPWVCAAAIRSIQHFNTLRIFDVTNPPGVKPKLTNVYEQRITSLVIHVLILLMPAMSFLIKLIPVPVLLGLFVYLCYVSFSGIQLATRVQLLCIPAKYHPKMHYVRKVRTWKMHAFTIVQCVAVAILWSVKLSPASIAYPMSIVLLIPLRNILSTYFFTNKEIEALDSEENYPSGSEEYLADSYSITTVPY